MELRVLRYLLTVVDERNISRAAEKLHVSQPTISRQIKDLEDELGVVLFDRGTRSIDLTQAGSYFVDQARQIVALADKTVANVQRTQEIQGRITIGCAEAPMMVSIATAVNKLRESAPKVQVDLYSSDATDVDNRLQSGLVDFGVVMEPTDKRDYHFLSLLGTTNWGVLARRDSPLANHPAVTATDLKQEPVIISQQHGSVQLLANWLGSSENSLNIVATYNLLYNASLMVQAGVGVALCLDGIINTASTDLTFIPLAPRLTTRSSLVWSAGRMSAAANAFLAVMRAQLPSA